MTRAIFSVLLLLMFPAIASAQTWQYTDATNSAVVRTNPNGSIESRVASDPEVQAAITAGNVKPYVAPPPPIPQTISAMQAKVALSRAGLLTPVQNWVASQNAETQLIWANASSFSRDSTMLNGAAAALGLTPAQVDALFVTAAEINP